MALSPAGFYDDIAPYYELVYADWEGSMRRHGAAIARIIGRSDSGARILDAAAGIGTQALPLASLGYEVVARDLSPAAIRRLGEEAGRRELRIDAAVADMRDVGRSVDGAFDAVIAFDNAVPHLLSDEEIVGCFRGWSRLLKPRGIVLISVRDYDDVDRAPRSVHPHGEGVREGRRYRMRQEWEWYDAEHYRTTMVVEEQRNDGWEEVVRTAAAYYAIPIRRLLELMEEAGLRAERVEATDFFQPVLRARRP